MEREYSRWRLRPEERRTILVIGDFIVALLALVIALVAWGQRDWLDFSQLLMQRIPRWFFLLPLGWLLLNIEMYDIRRAGRKDETVKGILIAAGVGLMLYLFVFFFSTPGDMPRVGVAVYIAAVTLLTLGWRFLYIRVFTAPEFLRRVLIVGAGVAGTTLANVVNSIRPQPFQIIGFIDDNPEKVGTEIAGLPVIGDSSRLLELIEEHQVTDLIFAISGDLRPETFRVLVDAQERGVQITTMISAYERLLGRVPIFLLPTEWILRSFVDYAHTDSFYEMSKRILDILGGLVGTLITLVLYPFIALAIWLDSGSPVVFTQTRVGKNGKEYTIYKFRTMRQDAEKDGKARVTVENDERITRVGKILRKSHLDELPQFINVLRGEMSLVGPRAERLELVQSLQKKVPFYRARLLVKPGITGWAQVNFGYAATVEDTAIKLEYDLYYIMHRNLLLDLLILLRTVGTVVGFKGQ